MTFKLPSQGFVFWPVGNGDSTTIGVDESTFIQVDLNHMVCAEQKDDPHTPVVDKLVNLLPKRNGKPYLSVFVLTHPDEDHCRGFKNLLKRVIVGELWFSPRVFSEYKKDLCDDATVFREEADRRVKKTIEEKGAVASGDRVRIIGYADILKEDKYKGFPEDRVTVPGNAVVILDGTNYRDKFVAFVHAPFKDDIYGERNESSISLQITLRSGSTLGQLLMFGDLGHPTLRRIFDKSTAATLAWGVMLSAHHCSKAAMYWKDEGDKDETLRQDILDDMKKAASADAYIISSSEPIPSSNKSGDNPPHAKAAERYREIVPKELLCTQEHGGVKAPTPIVFILGATGLQYQKPDGGAKAIRAGLAAAVEQARGIETPPRDRIGFGR